MTGVDERDKRRIAVSSRGASPADEVYERFGRSYWILIYCPASAQWLAFDNGLNRQRKSDAGLATAEALRDLGVTAVLTGETGPKVFRVLKSAGIAVVHNVNGTVHEVVRDWLGGNLLPARAANDPGSPNCLLGGGVGGRDGRRRFGL